MQILVVFRALPELPDVSKWASRLDGVHILVAVPFRI